MTLIEKCNNIPLKVILTWKFFPFGCSIYHNAPIFSTYLRILNFNSPEIPCHSTPPPHPRSCPPPHRPCRRVCIENNTWKNAPNFEGLPISRYNRQGSFSSKARRVAKEKYTSTRRGCLLITCHNCILYLDILIPFSACLCLSTLILLMRKYRRH